MSGAKSNNLNESNSTCEKPISGLSSSCKIGARNKQSILSRFLGFFGLHTAQEQTQVDMSPVEDSLPAYKNDLLIDEVSEEITLLARRNYGNLIRLFNEHSLDTIADRLLVQRMVIHRIRNGSELQRMASLLASVEYTVVGKNQAVYDIEYVKSLEYLAHKNLSSITTKAQS